MNKREITEKIFQEIKNNDRLYQLDHFLTSKRKIESSDDLIFHMWRSGRTGKDLSLTVFGNHCFRLADITKYDLSIPVEFVSNNISVENLILLKKMPCPYHLDMRNKTLTVYDETVAVMSGLYDSVIGYLRTLK